MNNGFSILLNNLPLCVYHSICPILTEKEHNLGTKNRQNSLYGLVFMASVAFLFSLKVNNDASGHLIAVFVRNIFA